LCQDLKGAESLTIRIKHRNGTTAAKHNIVIAPAFHVRSADSKYNGFRLRVDPYMTGGVILTIHRELHTCDLGGNDDLRAIIISQVNAGTDPVLPSVYAVLDLKVIAVFQLVLSFGQVHCYTVLIATTI